MDWSVARERLLRHARRAYERNIRQQCRAPVARRMKTNFDPDSAQTALQHKTSQMVRY